MMRNRGFSRRKRGPQVRVIDANIFHPLTQKTIERINNLKTMSRFSYQGLVKIVHMLPKQNFFSLVTNYEKTSDKQSGFINVFDRETSLSPEKMVQNLLDKNTFFKELDPKELCLLYNAAHPEIPVNPAESFFLETYILSKNGPLLILDFALNSGNFPAALKTIDLERTTKKTCKHTPPIFSENLYKYTPYDFILIYLCDLMKLESTKFRLQLNQHMNIQGAIVIPKTALRTFDLYLDFLRDNKHVLTGSAKEYANKATSIFFAGKYAYLQQKMYRIFFS